MDIRSTKIFAINAMYNSNGREIELYKTGEVDDKGNPVIKRKESLEFIGKKTGEEEFYPGQNTGKIDEKIQSVTGKIIEEWIKFERSRPTYIELRKQYQDGYYSQDQIDKFKQDAKDNIMHLVFPSLSDILIDNYYTTETMYSEQTTHDIVKRRNAIPGISELLPKLNDLRDEALACNANNRAAMKKLYDKIASMIDGEIRNKDIEFKTAIGFTKEQYDANEEQRQHLIKWLDAVLSQWQRTEYNYNSLFKADDKSDHYSSDIQDELKTAQAAKGKYYDTLHQYIEKEEEELIAIKQIEDQLYDEMPSFIIGQMPEIKIKEMFDEYDKARKRLEPELQNHKDALDKIRNDISQITSRIMQQEGFNGDGSSIEVKNLQPPSKNDPDYAEKMKQYNINMQKRAALKQKIDSRLAKQTDLNTKIDGLIRQIQDHASPVNQRKYDESYHLYKEKLLLMAIRVNFIFNKFVLTLKNMQDAYASIDSTNFDIDITSPVTDITLLCSTALGSGLNAYTSRNYISYVLNAAKRIEAINKALNISLVDAAHKKITENFVKTTFSSTQLNELASMILDAFDEHSIYYELSIKNKLMHNLKQTLIDTFKNVLINKFSIKRPMFAEYLTDKILKEFFNFIIQSIKDFMNDKYFKNRNDANLATKFKYWLKNDIQRFELPESFDMYEDTIFQNALNETTKDIDAFIHRWFVSNLAFFTNASAHGAKAIAYLDADRFQSVTYTIVDKQ